MGASEFEGTSCQNCTGGTYEQVAESTVECGSCGHKVGERSIDVS